MADLRKAIEANDAAAMQAGVTALLQAQHKVAEVLYRTAQATGAPQDGAPGAGAPGGGRAADGDVIDAEIVDDKK